MDTAYGSSDNLVWLTTKRKILPFIPVFDKGERTDGTFSRSDFNQTAQNLRKKVEMLFAHLKRILGFGRLRLRGQCGVQDEFTLAATAQNLRKLAKLKPLLPATG